MTRPGTLARLVAGKFIGGQKGFVQTFNWIAESLFNLKGGKGASIDWQDGSHPVINVEGGSLFEGTDGSQTDGTSSPVKFASAADSNVVVTCATDTITIGVYYV